MLRRFYLERKEDPTGISGTGRVAEGVEFEDGTVVWSWLSPIPGVTVAPSITVIEKLHSHNGRDPTKVVWIDELGEDIEGKASEIKTKKLKELTEEVEEKKEKEDDLVRPSPNVTPLKKQEKNKKKLEET